MAVAVMAARPLSMMEVDKEDHGVPEAQDTIDFVTMGMFIIGMDAFFFLSKSDSILLPLFQVRCLFRAVKCILTCERCASMRYVSGAAAISLG